MRLCNETITVFNTRFDPDADKDVYTGTVITGVSWFCEIASNVDSSGLKAANKFTIRIPTNADFSGKAYTDPVSYKNGDPSAVFTLQNGDIIVKGRAEDANPRPADLQKKYAEVVTVLGVTDNRRTRNAPHWKVVGA